MRGRNRSLLAAHVPPPVDVAIRIPEIVAQSIVYVLRGPRLPGTRHLGTRHE